jgi:hypothetical protein
VEPLKAVTEAVTASLKRAYTMSDSKKEQLVKARARAVELRTALNAIKPPKVKPVKIKKPSKMEIEISEIEASITTPSEPVAAEPVEVTKPVTEPVTEPVKEPKQKVLVKKQKEPPIKQRKPLMDYPPTSITPPPPTPPPSGFRRNSFGFFVL